MAVPIIVALIRAGIPATKLIARFGKKAFNEAKKHGRDITTKPKPGQVKIKPFSKGQRVFRAGQRVAAGVGVAAGTIGTQKVLQGRNKKRIEDALKRGEQKGRIEELLRQVYREEKEKEKQKQKEKTKKTGTITKASPPPKRPKPSGTLSKASPPPKRPKLK
tara:strand:+ start:318 stop:803 length:486 start_codon:yes stop_codon:yes gene_type:complete